MGSGKESKKNNDMFQLASSDEAKYNRLKSKIIENADTFVIFYLRLLNILFLLLSIFFIIYDSIINKRNMVNLDKYLNENLLFNHSKISAGILYLESNFYKYARDGYLNDSSCIIDSCHQFLIDQIIFSIDDIRNQKDKFSSLSSDFAEKVKIKEYLNVINKNDTELIEVNMEFMMNLLINYALRIREANLKMKGNVTLDNNESEEENLLRLNLSLVNLIDQSDKFVLLNINGYSNGEKTNKIDKLFNPFPLSLIIMTTFIILFIATFFYFIYYLYSYEVFFIEKLIDFNNPKYESYLKQLEELKKKLRNESEDEEDEEN